MTDGFTKNRVPPPDRIPAIVAIVILGLAIAAYSLGALVPVIFVAGLFRIISVPLLHARVIRTDVSVSQGVVVARRNGTELARVALELGEQPDEGAASVSARNRFPGLVTRVVRDKVMAQVEIQAGPHRIVSLISSEAVDALGLEVGSPAVAVATV